MRAEKPAKPDLNPPIQPVSPSPARQFEPLIDSRERFDSAVRVANCSPLLRLELVPIQNSSTRP